MAAEVQPPDWLRGQVLLLPHVPRRGLDGVEAVLPPGPSEQVTAASLVTTSIPSLPAVEIRLFRLDPGLKEKRSKSKSKRGADPLPQHQPFLRRTHACARVECEVVGGQLCVQLSTRTPDRETSPEDHQDLELLHTSRVSYCISAFASG